MDDEKAKPFREFRIGSVKAAVWKNGDNLSVTLQKSYKKDGEWQDTKTLFHDDVVCAIKVLERAERFMAQ